ncbi:MAG TPA: 16S rRNA (guanine(966)-N(2))-methyltransferase RsmD [Candidatus Saccharimonadales bacterium]|nr:16S rRNA (guanine(966)-N(2))-methyltransferase RsmD [Candidatus Saccharimonadales bacterium]
MRIIAGRYKGLNFNAPKGARTHPMSDKARGGLFNALGDIEGLEVLDCFSGSGALAIEAISRGARSAVAIDADSRAVKIIKDTLTQLKLTKEIKVSQAYVKSWLSTNKDKTFDLILVDPPYDDLNFTTIKRLPLHLKESGVLVLSWPGSHDPLKLSGLQIVKNKHYGDAQLVFYRKIS